METMQAAALFAVLGHENRLEILRMLMRRAPQAVRAGEIAGVLGVAPSTLSAHLAALEGAGLIGSERSGRLVLYHAEVAMAGALIGFLYDDCCRGRADLCLPGLTSTPLGKTAMSEPFHALFICSGNSARSIFAEALLRDLGQGRFAAHSAGTRPRSELNPFALEVLARNGHDTSSLRAKNVSEFQGAEAPRLDFVFTVCDAAANEACPPWPGQPITAHWGMPDPVKAEGTEAEKALAFARVYGELRRRIIAFTALPVAELTKLALQERVDAIGRSQA
ncbi:MAG: metalloregulator ArsR/SmtB family transcription factor [Paracoccaceae bacterium]|nr:MAG: metalloregulator ArsR/SmtB family transcription factor [Paracoccaceae bacterium]